MEFNADGQLTRWLDDRKYDARDHVKDFDDTGCPLRCDGLYEAAPPELMIDVELIDVGDAGFSFRVALLDDGAWYEAPMDWAMVEVMFQ